MMGHCDVCGRSLAATFIWSGLVQDPGIPRVCAKTFSICMPCTDRFVEDGVRRHFRARSVAGVIPDQGDLAPQAGEDLVGPDGA